MNEPATKHYDSSYFDYQSSIGEFGGWANLTKFSAYISSADLTVMDFGCGGGYLLKNIECATRIGIEVNPTAANTARKNGIIVYQRTSDAPDACADVIVSNHALEHTLHPLVELRELRRKLKPDGTIAFVVPCETVSYCYRPGDINKHLYSWSPMCLGNLFAEAGFNVIESKPYIHKWPIGYRLIAKIGGRRLFDWVSKIYGRLERSWNQVRIVATLPKLNNIPESERPTSSTEPSVPFLSKDDPVQNTIARSPCKAIYVNRAESDSSPRTG